MWLGEVIFLHPRKLYRVKFVAAEILPGGNLAGMYMLWFNFVHGVNLISICFKFIMIIIHYYAQYKGK